MAAYSVLVELVRPNRLTRVVDIGANPIDGSPPYLPMLQAGIAEVVGFEPQEDALRQLEENKGPHERYLPHAIGDGEEHLLNICNSSGMTSFLEPDENVLEHFELLASLGKVIERIPVETRRLDDVAEIESIDFLKMDVQGFEMEVLRNGRAKLGEAVAIQTEMSFVALYQDQPTIGEMDIELRSRGFIPHALAETKRWVIAPTVLEGDPRTPLNQLLEADIVYVRDFTKPQTLTDEQLKHLCLIVHVCYHSWDLANRCLYLLEQRGSLPLGSQQRYFEALAAGQI